MGSRPPARTLFLRPGRVQPTRPTLPDQIFPAKLPHKHKHRMCLAGLPAFSSRARGNEGKFLTKLQGPHETMGGSKFSCEPRRGAGSTNQGFVPGGKCRGREQCPGLESGSRLAHNSVLSPLAGAGDARGSGEAAGLQVVRTGAQKCLQACWALWPLPRPGGSFSQAPDSSLDRWPHHPLQPRGRAVPLPRTPWDPLGSLPLPLLLFCSLPLPPALFLLCWSFLLSAPISLVPERLLAPHLPGSLLFILPTAHMFGYVPSELQPTAAGGTFTTPSSRGSRGASVGQCPWLLLKAPPPRTTLLPHLSGPVSSSPTSQGWVGVQGWEAETCLGLVVGPGWTSGSRWPYLGVEEQRGWPQVLFLKGSHRVGHLPLLHPAGQQHRGLRTPLSSPALGGEGPWSLPLLAPTCAPSVTRWGPHLSAQLPQAL